MDIVVPGIVMCLIGYFSYHVVQGDLGLLSYLKMDRQIETLEAKAASIGQERATLEHRVSLMSPSGVDPDLLDERARYELGFAHPQDLVIFTQPAN
jgi:cell division protein FtsB